MVTESEDLVSVVTESVVMVSEDLVSDDLV